jgi:hypothetical protein
VCEEKSVWELDDSEEVEISVAAKRVQNRRRFASEQINLERSPKQKKRKQTAEEV